MNSNFIPTTVKIKVMSLLKFENIDGIILLRYYDK